MSGRHRPVENSLLTKHVVAAGNSAKDAGSTPAASTILRSEPRQRCRAEDGALRSFSEGGPEYPTVPSYGWQAPHGFHAGWPTLLTLGEGKDPFGLSNYARKG